MSSKVVGVGFDAQDALAAAAFWAETLGGTVAEGGSSEHATVVATEPVGRIGFHQVPEGKTVKNRMHFDLITTDFDAETDRLISLGATKLNEVNRAYAHWATLAD